MQKGRHSLKYRRIQQDLMALVFQHCQLDVLPEAGCGSAIRLTEARRCHVILASHDHADCGAVRDGADLVDG